MVSVSGVYCIKNLLNGKRYFGSAKNCDKRKSIHFSTLRHGKHHNPHLQSAWRKYGEPAFSFEVVEQCHEAMLLVCEQKWLDAERPEYNVLTEAGRPTGYVASPETRHRRSLAQLGTTRSPAMRAGISKALTGRKRDREVVERIASKLRGRPGSSPSAETRLRISDALSGRVLGPRSASTREKIRAKAIGRTHSLASKALISANRSGKGTGPKPAEVGVSIARAKAALIPDQVIEIRRLAAAGVTHSRIAEQFGIVRSVASSVASGRSYAWVPW